MMEKTVIMSQLIRPYLIDIDTHHSPEFHYDGLGTTDDTCLIMCFRTPFRILTVNGMETGNPGDCILHSLEFRQYHSAEPGARSGFRNDWLKVDFAAVSPLISELNLPCDTLLPTGRPDLLENHIREIREDLDDGDEFSERSILLHLHRLLLSIRRGHDRKTRRQETQTPSEQCHYPRFREIRDRLRRECVGEFHIAALAAETNLSPERFAALYRKFFDKSPYAELIDARLLAARRLLCTTNATIKEIAAACGWRDQYYFSRLFKEKYAVPPKIFRENASRR